MNWKVKEASLNKWHNTALERAHLADPTEVPRELQGVLQGLKGLSPDSEKLMKLSPKERSLLELQRSEAASALRKCAHLTREVVSTKELLSKVLSGNFGELPEKTKLNLARALREKIEGLREEFQVLSQDSPEAFLAVHSRTLRLWRRQLEKGRLVVTPYVQEKLDEVVDHLQHGRVVIIHGETGTGKTELARLAAKIATGKEPELVRGFSGMDSRELFGHMQLTKSGEGLHEISKVIDEAITEWKKVNPDASADEISNASGEITTKALIQNQVTVSEYVLGAVYRAARDGRVVILDEANYIPPDLIAKLNDILTKRPGEKINIQEDGLEPITIAKGFGVAMTGNINKGSQKRYGHRFDLDPALQDRAQLVEYHYLPQETAGTSANHGIKDKQLYAIVLGSLLAPRVSNRPGASIQLRLEDRIGSMVLPDGAKALDELWRLSQLASVTQLAFSGKISNSNPFAFQKNGVSTGLQTDIALSPRRLISLVQEWRDSGFERPLSHYLEKRLVEQALKPEHREYFSQLCQKFGFSSAANKVVGDIEIVSGRVVIESLFGAIPERTKWPGSVKPKVEIETEAAKLIAASSDLKSELSKARELLAEFRTLGVPQDASTEES